MLGTSEERALAARWHRRVAMQRDPGRHGKAVAGRGAHGFRGRPVFVCVLCLCLCSLPLPLSTASGEPGRWLGTGAAPGIRAWQKFPEPMMRPFEASNFEDLRVDGEAWGEGGGDMQLRGGQQHTEARGDEDRSLQCTSTAGCACCGSCDGARGVASGSHPVDATIEHEHLWQHAADGQHEHMWKQDVGERYKQLVPPRHPSRHSRHAVLVHASGPQTAKTQAADIRDRLAKASLSSQLPRKCVDEVNMFLDLDKAAIWGNDGNDFGIALQWMERPYEDVLALYKHLLNPNVKQTYQALSARANKVNVVIYTMRSSLLLYHSCFRDAESAMVPLLWHPEWHKQGQLYLPPDLANSEDIMTHTQWARELLESERLDMRNALERLLAVRQVITEELALADRPLVVVSAERKSVMKTAKVLNLDSDACYLWDDNTKFAPHENVVRVAPYVAMPESRRAQLLKFMYRTLPLKELDPDLVDFLLDAPASDSALVQQPSGELAYHVACATNLEPWALPRTGVWGEVTEADASACSVRQTAAESSSAPMGKDVGKDEDGAWGLLSPVTPLDAKAEAPLWHKARDHGGAISLQEHQQLSTVRLSRIAAGGQQAGSRPGISPPGAGIYRVFTGPSP